MDKMNKKLKMTIGIFLLYIVLMPVLMMRELFKFYLNQINLNELLAVFVAINILLLFSVLLFIIVKTIITKFFL